MSVSTCPRPLRTVALAITALVLLSDPLIAEQPPKKPQETVSSAVVSAASVDKAAEQKLVTNVFYETSLRQVLTDIATQVGVIIVPDMTVRGVVTCELKDVPLDRAIDIVLAGTGYAVKKTPDYYLVCSVDMESPSFSLISETRVVKLNYVGASAAAKQLSKPFQNYVQAEEGGNTVAITGPKTLCDRIVADLKLIDRPTKHVLLTARIMVLDRNGLKNLGVQWDWPTITAGIFTNSDYHGGGLPGPDWPWGLQIGYTPGLEFTSSLNLTLNLLVQNGEATVAACPQLMAQDGKEAEIKVTTEEYFEITSEGVYVTSKLEKIETGTILKIAPRIGETGEITLSLGTEVSGVVARGENNLPVVTRRTATSTVRINDGGTVVIAGLMDHRTEDVAEWVPGIGRAKGLGRLFRNDMGKSTSRQIAVFITASLLGERKQKDTSTAAPRQIAPVSEAEFTQALRESLKRVGSMERPQ
jgi:type II secretory pathway component GspD/PulD (secretin)